MAPRCGAIVVFLVLMSLSFFGSALKKVIQLPLRVHVILVGLEGMDSVPLLLKQSLDTVMHSVLPDHSRNLALELSYDVETGDKVTPAIIDEYLKLVLRQEKPDGTTHDVSAQDLKSFLHTTSHAHGDMAADFNHLPILVMASKRVPPHRLRTADGQASLVHMDDMLFLDLSATATGTGEGEDEVGVRALLSDGSEEQMLSTLIAHVAAAVMQHGVGSLELRQSYYASQVVLPALLLRSTDMLGAEDFKVDHVGLKEWADSLLLPTQTASVVSTMHFVSEHPQISVALSLAEYTRSYYGRQGSLQFPEAVPVLDAAHLARELANIGDRITAQLLSKTGYEEAAGVATSRPLAAAAMRVDTDGGEDFVKMFKAKHGVGDAEGRMSGGMSVVPLVVVSDLHRRLNRNPNPTSQKEAEVDVLPLLDGDDLVQYRSERALVLALHASDPVLVHSMHHNEWHQVGASTLSSILTAAVTTAVSSLRPTYDEHIAPPTNGLLPVWPAWTLPTRAEAGHGPAPGVMSWTARRTAFAARTYEALRVSAHVQESAQARLAQATDAMHVALGLSTSQLETGALSQLLPSTCAMHIVWLEDATMSITEKMSELQGAIRALANGASVPGGKGAVRVDDLLEVLRGFEAAVTASARTVLTEGRVLKSQMESCLVELTLVDEKKSKKNKASSTGEKGVPIHLLASEERVAAAKELKQRSREQAGDSSWAIKVAVLLALLVALIVMRRIQRQMGDKAKKSQ